MREALLCPKCGRVVPEDAAHGLCPVCMLRTGLGEPSALADGVTIAPQRDATDLAPPGVASAATIDGLRTVQPMRDGDALPMADVLSEPAAFESDAPVICVPGYEILGELGRGGMGVVYKARHKKLGRVVALKMILAGGHAGEADLARFRTEAEAIARLQHANIVQVHEISEHEGKPYFSLEFCAGGSLAQKIDGTPMQPTEAANMVEVLARGVAAAHQKGIVHRDLKPANVLLLEDGTPKITDFGLAKKLDDIGQTQTGAIMGTPSYMAPEQAGGKGKEVGPAADVYALGAILYELLTGRPPFKAATPLDTILQVVADDPVPPSQLQKKMPRDVETICLKCLQKEPAKRYASAQALADDLQRYQNGEPIQARPVGQVERAVKWVKRRPAVAGLIATVVAVTVIGLGGFGWAFGQTVVARDDAEKQAVRAGQERDNAQDQEKKTAEALMETVEARNQADVNRKKAENEKTIAEKALAEAEAARKQAEAARSEAVAATSAMKIQLRRAEGLLYINQFTEAHNHYLNNDPDRCRLALNDCRVDFRGPEYGYLLKQLDKKARTFSGHKIHVTGLVLSRDGKRLYSASWDKTVKVWDLETGTEALTLRGHTMEVMSLALSDDGKRLVSRSPDSTIKVWDLETGKEAVTLRGLALSGDGKRLFSIRDRAITVSDLETGKETLTLPLPGQAFGAKCLTVSRDGKRLVAASGGSINVWDLESGKLNFTLRSNSRIPISTLALSDDGKRLFSGGDDSVIKVWDLETGRESPSLRGHSGEITALVLSDDGKRLFSASGSIIKEWNMATGREVLTLRGHNRAVLSLALSRDGKRLFSAGGDWTIKEWNLELGNESANLRGHLRSVTSVAVSGDGTRLFSGSQDNTIKVWDMKTGKESRTLRGQRSVTCLVLSRDDKRLYSGSWDKTIKIWDLDTGTDILTLPGHGLFVGRLALSDDGKRLVSIGDSSTIKVWDLATGKESFLLPGGPGVASMALSGDGKRLYSGGGSAIKVWDLEAGKEILTLRGRIGVVYSLAVSSDGKRLISGSQDGILKVWDLQAGKEILTLRGHSSSVSCLVLSPDGKRLFSGSADSTIKLWDLEAGKETLTLRGHSAGVTSLVLSRDGKLLLSGSADKTIKVWDLGAG